MAHDEGLPGIGEAQEIGQDATRSLYTNSPKNWVTPKDLGGTDDYGLDFQIQLKAQSQASAIFRLQLKGTKSPSRVENGTFISIPLSASTLRYYRKISEPILLVICDLSVDEDPRKCPLYYVWVREELRRINIDTVDLAQEKVSLRVPTANQLTYELDLLREVRNAHELAEAGHALDVRVNDLRPELQPEQRVEVVQNLTEGFNRRSAAFLDAVAAPASEHWPKPETGTLAADLIETARLQKTGKLERAVVALDRARTKLAGTVGLELGEYHFLAGRQAMLNHDDDAASTSFLSAARTTGQSKHWAGWAESEVRRRYNPDGPNVATLDFSDVLAALPAATDGILAAARARLLAASHKADEARTVLAQFSGAECMAGLAVVETMNSNWDAALAACNAGLADPQCSESSRLLFQILRARGKFHQAVVRATHKIEGEIVPPSGPPGVNAALLREAWTDIVALAESMDEIGWASNAEFVADIVAACAAMLGKQNHAMTILRSAIQKQSASKALNASLEVIAAQCGKFDVALEANTKQDRSDTQILRRIALLYEVGKRRRECVALAEHELPNLPRQHQLFGVVLVLAARAAHDVARADLVRSWSELLEADESLRPHAASLEYYLSVATSPLSASDALTALAKRHEDLGRPLPTATIIFEETDPSDKAQAHMLVEVADELKAHIRLAPGMAVHLGMALATLGQWIALLELCEEAEREFDGNPRLVAFKGLALDRLGNTEAARQVLKNMLEGGLADSLALRTYVNIMVRCGFLDEALVATEKILDASSSIAQKRECIRLLFNLLQTTNPQEPRLVDLAIRFGELADPAVEVEEGVFLTMVCVGTSMSSGVVSVEKKKEIEERAKVFFERFSDSTVLRRIETGDASGDELLERLKTISGVTEERQRMQSRLEREMRDGKLPIPFAWRPKLAFLNIRDQLHLWEVSKRASPDDRQFHLIMETAQWTPKRAADLRGKIPLVDLTTLFVLLDLELLDSLFMQFSTVAIAQGTLAELSTLCQLFSGCPWRDKCLNLQGRLRQKLNQITQPIAHTSHEEQVEAEDGIPVSASEIRILCNNGSYFLYSDDLIVRHWCLGESAAQNSMSTLDLLEVLEERDIIDRARAARAIARLCAWNVGVAILPKHLLAMVPQGAVTARSIFEGVSCLHSDNDFMSIATGIWDFRLDFYGNLKHVAALTGELVNEPSVSVVAAASFAGVWYLKAKLRDEAPRPPLRLLTNFTLVLAANLTSSGLKAKPGTQRRLLQVFIYLVELEFGNRMDESVEKEAYSQLARAAVEMDRQRTRRAAEKGAQLVEHQTSLYSWILKGFEAKTGPFEVFSKAYRDIWDEVAQHAMRQKR